MNIVELKKELAELNGEYEKIQLDELSSENNSLKNTIKRQNLLIKMHETERTFLYSEIERLTPKETKELVEKPKTEEKVVEKVEKVETF